MTNKRAYSLFLVTVIGVGRPSHWSIYSEISDSDELARKNSVLRTGPEGPGPRLVASHGDRGDSSEGPPAGQAPPGRGPGADWRFLAAVTRSAGESASGSWRLHS